MKASHREIMVLWQRAQEALRATQTRLTSRLPNFSAARTYYAAFDAGAALLQVAVSVTIPPRQMLVGAMNPFTRHRGG